MTKELSYDSLQVLQKEHPAWRLLRSDHAPLVASFLNRVFISPNIRVLSEPDLVELLEDELFGLRQILGVNAFPRSARDYLNDWASAEKGWLRKFYLHGTDEAHFDLLPATERAIAWMSELEDRSFVGTESRLLTIFELLHQMVAGSQEDPVVRVKELQKRRDAIDAEIALTLGGEVPLLDDTAMRDRFQQFHQMARELLSDFREVEQNFRKLDRSVRERIALWEGGRAALLDDILGHRNAIDESDQGRSFRAFWDFLMSDSRQQELTGLLDAVLSHEAIQATDPDPRLRRVHYDWLQAGDHTQRTVADLSKQLRRFLDDQAWLENRRIMDLLRNIEAKSISIRDNPPSGPAFMDIRETTAGIGLPFERPLFTPAFKLSLASEILAASGEDIDASALFAAHLVDKAALKLHIRQTLQDAPQITLSDLIRLRPLDHGLAEIVAYLELASGAFTMTVDESSQDVLSWISRAADGTSVRKIARLPRVIFIR